MTMESPTDTVIYRSKLNPKINRNFEVFTPTDFLAAITQHRSSAKCEVRVSKQDRQRGSAKASVAFRIRHSPFVIWLTPPPPTKLPSKKWRDLIPQVWHSDPLLCPKCQHPMRLIAVIDQRAVIEKILRHLGQWNGTPPLAPARAPPAANTGLWTREPCDDVDPMPDYENVLTD